MLHKEKKVKARHTEKGNSLSQKIISKMAVYTAGIFLLTILMSAFLAARSLIEVNRDKLAAVAYENAFLDGNDIENAYGKVVGFAGALRNISTLDPKEQRAAIDTALVGMLESGGGYPTAFAYFEQNTIADENGLPYSVHHKDIAYEAVVYPNEQKNGYVFEKHEDAFDNFEKEYYMQIKETRQPYVMDPYIYELMGKNIMMISIIAPILDADGNFLGVTGVDVGLENMQEELLVSTDYKTAHLTALAADGTILMDSADAQKVGMSAKDAGYETLMEDAQKVYAMQEGEYQNSRYLIKSGKNFGTGKRGMTVTIPLTIGGKAKWSLHMAVNSSEFNWAIIESTGKLTFIVVVFGILLLFSVNRIIKSFLEPIQTITDGAAKLEAGDLNIHIDISSDDELGRLSQAFNHISTTMSNYVKDISEQLSKMAENHMDIAITQDYIGDFIPIQASIEKISQSLNDTLHEIVLSADEVAASSENVSSGAQVLSDGAAEQAAAIDELAASIDSLSKDVAANANDAQTANTAVTQVSASIAQSNKEMDDLTEAMAKINASSEEIEKIVKTIEDIAEQTNLLSLNASIEAARAGEAGKGFAVVANQIRELAAKSAEAVNQTADLIRTSQNAVENGMGIAEHTADSLVAVVNGAKEVLCSMEKISNASQNQKSVLEQLTRHVDAISGVVQSNSSAAKGSADTSAELSAQSKRLHELVSKFHLKQM
ncbi:MAG: HAMP domain-containing protein [Eubacterium sp.]|jgi:methyl-accepting chemotaxis protein|nr:HAMP domain-containing protein [Eubacterium sp.]